MRVIDVLFFALSLPLMAGELPPDAAALKAQRDAKIADLNRVYATELEKLQKVALKSGNLEAANAIEGEIATAMQKPFKQSDVNPVGKWKWESGGIMTLETDGRASHTEWSQAGTWKKSDDGATMLYSKTGIVFRIMFETSDRGRVKVTNGKGTTIITRVGSR